ncbi:hypothetical protein FBY35_6236 [Streptomyces sp. SLBN-118]|uniref:hypothetical protein n=1 Tax=Streptomyces sp. SLBN-118 TaxID=2768454 RepID=UPI001172B4DF|nr:hypothetical protein [Streptomyces sp. SLBN-118]TQK44713.1 hypothetical protein FBY35_6236 [Streptomyces sp. SLBN-118]
MTTTADSSMHLGPDEPSRRLRAEIERLRDEAARQRALAHRRAEFWNRAHIVLGFPAALLAGISGAAGLATADARVPAALIALASAGFAAGSGFLRSDARRVANKRARQAWADLEGRASVKLAHERLTPEDLRELLQSRQAALAAYDGEGPQPGPQPVLPG